MQVKTLGLVSPEQVAHANEVLKAYKDTPSCVWSISKKAAENASFNDSGLDQLLTMPCLVLCLPVFCNAYEVQDVASTLLPHLSTGPLPNPSTLLYSSFFTLPPRYSSTALPPMASTLLYSTLLPHLSTGPLPNPSTLLFILYSASPLLRFQPTTSPPPLLYSTPLPQYPTISTPYSIPCSALHSHHHHHHHHYDYPGL
jgi:hypothetical protein